MLTPLFFFWRRALLAFLVPVAVALAAALLAPKVYVADTSLLILLGDEYTAHSATGTGQNAQSFDRTQIVKAETGIIASRELAEATIREVGLRRLYPQAPAKATPASTVERFSKDLSIDNVPQSNVVALSLKNRDGAVAAQALNTLVKLYLDRRPAIFAGVNPGVVDRQTAVVNGELADVERQIAAMAGAHRFGDYQLELTGATNQQGALQTQLGELDRQAADRQGELAALQEQQGAIPERTTLSSDYNRPLGLDSLEQSLAGLQTQRREDAQTYVDGSPITADVDRRIARVRAQIATAQKSQLSGSRLGVNPLWQDVGIRLSTARAALAGLERSRAAAQGQMEGVNGRLAELTAIGPQYRDLVRRRDLLAANASDLARQDQDARLRNTLSRAQANVRVLQPASPPLRAKSQRLPILLAGIAIGLVDAAAVVLLSVAIFQGMLTAGAVEKRLSLPVLLTLDNDPAAARRRRRGKGAPTPAFMTLGDAKVVGQLLRSLAPRSPNVVQLIGPADGVGVTSLVLDLALMTQTARRRVLVIDAEPLAGRSLADIARRRGLKLAPVSDGAKAVRLEGSNLFLTQLSDLGGRGMSEERWREALADVSRVFDLVLIDSPPLTRSSAGLLATPRADLTLAVIEAERTHAAAAINMVERIAAVGGQVTAAIFNKRRFYLPRALYRAL